MADLILQRSKSTKLGTASTLFFGDESVFVVEDVVREPTIGRPDDPKLLDAWVRRWKVAGDTAIPAGRYRLAWTYSPSFKRRTLELIGVPGFGGIRVHAGNNASHTRGCIAPGLARHANGVDVLQSALAVAQVEGFVLPQLSEKHDVFVDVRNVEGWGF